MKRIIIAIGLGLSVLSGVAAIRSVTPTLWPAGKDGTRCWQLKRHDEKMSVVTNGGAKVVFIGDSITHFWETKGKKQLAEYFSAGDMKMLDLGTSADRTEHVLWRLREGGELDGYEAKFIHIMIGTNNTGHFPFAKEPPADTILGIREILKTVREKQPGATIVLSSIFPRGARPDDPKRMRNDIVNAEIAKFCDGKTVFWAGYSDDFLDADGNLPKTIFPDGLHPVGAGYEIWRKAISPYLDWAMTGRTGPTPRNRFAIHHTAATRPDETPVAAWPATRIDGKSWWVERLLEKRNQISGSGGEIDIVLAGDSITHNWERAKYGKAALDELSKTYSVLDIGYGGDRVEHLLWRMKNGELDGYKAKCITVMIGTNNSRATRPEDTAAGVKAVLETIAEKQPDATTLLFAIFPRGQDSKDPRRIVNSKVNEIIKGYADGKKVVWIDIGDKFLDANGDVKAMMNDRLHPGPKGYEIWTTAALPWFKKACGK